MFPRGLEGNVVDVHLVPLGGRGTLGGATGANRRRCVVVRASAARTALLVTGTPLEIHDAGESQLERGPLLTVVNKIGSSSKVECGWFNKDDDFSTGDFLPETLKEVIPQ